MKLNPTFVFSTLTAVVLFTLLILTNSKIISKERYEEIKQNANFEVIDYDDYLANYANKLQYSYNLSYEALLSEAKIDFEQNASNNNLKFLDENILSNYAETITIPYEFNWTTKVPECFTVPIKDQDTCGSCYSFSSTFSLAKRMCLFDRKYINLDLSPQDLVSCDNSNDKCDGGNIAKVWKYLENEGVTTEACIPYESYVDDYDIEHYPKCISFCRDYNLSYTKYTAEKDTLKRTNNDIETRYEILLFGPVSTFMKAYDDLLLYKGGIYIPTTTIDGEGHAVSLVGWGYDFNIDTQYWIVANSWGANWGENGYFKIPFNSSEINKFSYASKPLGWNGRNLYNSVVTK